MRRTWGVEFGSGHTRFEVTKGHPGGDGEFGWGSRKRLEPGVTALRCLSGHSLLSSDDPETAFLKEVLSG